MIHYIYNFATKVATRVTIISEVLAKSSKNQVSAELYSRLSLVDLHTASASWRKDTWA